MEIISLDQYRGTNLIKGFVNAELELEKGAKGEGSRGGKVIGHTRSGKAIYENADHESHKNFSKDEHADAILLHQNKQNSLKRGASRLQKQGDDLKFNQKLTSHSVAEVLHKRMKESANDNKPLEKSQDSPKKADKIKKVMEEFKAGTLKSSSGEKVTDRKQAIAIALSEAQALDKGKDELIAEHERLVHVLESDSHEDDKKEAKKQAKELEELKKGKAANIGEIREWSGKRYKKQANGKWLEVSVEQSNTKARHQEIMDWNKKQAEVFGNPNSELYDKKSEEIHIDGMNWHKNIAEKLSDKEHSDEEVGWTGFDDEKGKKSKKNNEVYEFDNSKSDFECYEDNVYNKLTVRILDDEEFSPIMNKMIANAYKNKQGDLKGLVKDLKREYSDFRRGY